MAGKAPHFNLGFTGLSDKKLDDKVNLILKSMTGNANYTSPGTRIGDVATEQAAYAMIKGSKGSIINYKNVKKTGKQDLIDVLVVLGVWARDKYPGNVLIWGTTGYTIQEYDTVTVKPKVPQGVKGKDGVDFGTVEISFTAVDFATEYQGRFCKKGEAMPTGMTISKKMLRLLFLNLIQGVPYSFQVRASGTLGFSDWGTIVNWIPRVDPNAGVVLEQKEIETPEAAAPEEPTTEEPTKE